MIIITIIITILFIRMRRVIIVIVIVIIIIMMIVIIAFSHISDTAGRGSRLPQLFRGSNPHQSSMKSVDSTSTSAGQFASPGGNLPSEILVKTHLPAGAATP